MGLKGRIKEMNERVYVEYETTIISKMECDHDPCETFKCQLKGCDNLYCERCQYGPLKHCMKHFATIFEDFETNSKCMIVGNPPKSAYTEAVVLMGERDMDIWIVPNSSM